MDKWLPQYTKFRQKDCEQLCQKYNASRFHIQDGHIVIQKMQNILQTIENTLADEAHRPRAEVILTLSRNLGKSITGKPLSPEEKWHNEVSHNFVTNQHKLVWYANATNPSEFDLLFALIHESEHAAQSIGYGYNENEHKLIWIERACHGLTDAQYASRFSEMCARIKEAQLCINMLTIHKSHLSIHDQQNVLYIAQGVLRRLKSNCTPQKINELQQIQQSYLRTKITPLKYLQKAFPKMSILQRNKQAYNFLKNIAPDIYRECFNNLQNMQQQQLSDLLTDCQIKIPALVQQYEHKQEIERLSALAQKYNIPIIKELPKKHINNTDL